MNYGLRLSSFLRLGQDEINIYENNNPVIFNSELNIYEKATPIGTENLKRNEVIKSFFNFEPRLALAYQFNDETSLKASYNKISQYLHLLSNTSSPTPLDVWTPSGDFIKPQILHQYALGFFKTISDNTYNLELEAYYKNIDNRIDYTDSADLIANNAIEQVILNGQARAYGLEFLLRKNKGDFQGWIAYTLSKSEQQTKGRTPSEIGINNGRWYNTPYDKTHDVSITTSYRFNEKWSFNANFLFQTGLPVTYPNGQYNYNGISIPIYEDRNSSRIPKYNRMDVSAKYIPKLNAERKWKTEWVFSIYNIYNRNNASSISFRENRTTGVNESFKQSLFGIIPSISYNFKF